MTVPAAGAPGQPPVEDVVRLRAERDEAVATCRRLEHELGELRARTKRLELMMYRRTMRRQRWMGRAHRLAALIPGRR